MAQVVQSRGWVVAAVMTGIGAIMMLNGVPALFQWVPWVVQAAVVLGLEDALDQAFVPLAVAAMFTFFGFMLARGGLGVLVSTARQSAQRAQGQARRGIDQLQRQVQERASQVQSHAQSQASDLVNRVPQGWRERLEAAAAAVAAERDNAARQAADARPQWEGQGARAMHEAAASQHQPVPQHQAPHQQPAPTHQPADPQRSRPAQQPGSARLARIDDLQRQLDDRRRALAQAANHVQHAAEGARAAARAEAAGAAAALPTHLDAATQALVANLDVADGERAPRHRSPLSSSSLTRSSLSTSALAGTSLTLNSLLQHRR